MEVLGYLLFSVFYVSLALVWHETRERNRRALAEEREQKRQMQRGL